MKSWPCERDAAGLRVAVVVSRFNHLICVRLLDGCVNELVARGASRDDVHVAWVPGAFEIPQAALEQASSRQLVVATVPDLQGYPIEDYGYRLGRAWGLGQEEANNGAILLVAPNERRVRIEVGYGLEPILTDALSHGIIEDRILPRFRDNDYPGGIAAGADAIIEQLQAPPEEAERRCRRALMEVWVGRETAAFRLPPSRLALDPADPIRLAHDGRMVDLRLVSIADAEAHGIEAVRQVARPTICHPEIRARRR